MLLSHTSGLGEYQKSFGMDPEKWTREWTPEELIAEANKAGSVGKPGSSVAHYSNTNYIMLGRIIEMVTGNSWAHEVESRIVQPLALGDTIVGTGELPNIGLVPGYMKTSDGYLNLMEHPWYPRVSASVGWATGGIVSNVSDLMTFASALFDGKLVSKETLAIMTQPVGNAGGRAWALGGGAMEVGGHKAFGMGGDTVGYHAYFIGLLDSKLIVTALVNTEEGDVISPSMTALQTYINQQTASK
jgi:D-alanyl-D-alanine carboxypeptidase